MGIYCCKPKLSNEIELTDPSGIIVEELTLHRFLFFYGISYLYLLGNNCLATFMTEAQRMENLENLFLVSSTPLVFLFYFLDN